MTDIDHLDPDLDDFDDDEEGPTLLDRAAIMQATSAAQVRTEIVPIPELGGSVKVRELSGALRNLYESAAIQLSQGGDGKSMGKTYVQMIAACVVDVAGQPILKENDARRIIVKHPRAATRLREAIFNISGMDADDAEALAEGFGDDQSDSSTSG